MKKLQNDFTTPEQSKRLLELGVPADSADCFYYSDNQGEEEFPNIIPIVNDGEICFSLFCDNKAVPCWSYGRLIKIYDLCAHGFYTLPKVPQDLIEHILSRYDWEIRNVGMDFSKLEE